MKKILILILTIIVALVEFPANSQIAVVGKARIKRTVSNPDNLLQVEKITYEIFPENRIIQLDSKQFVSRASDSMIPLSKGQFIYAYNHTLGDVVALTGEINFKLRSGVSISQIGAWSSRAKILVKPDVYTIVSTTPIELLSVFKDIKSTGAVEWIEPFGVPTDIQN